MSKKNFLAGAFTLALAGILTRIIGFFYRIFLSHTIGAQGMGLLQLAIPVQTLVLAVTTAGMQMTISRLCASHLALGEGRRSRELFAAGTFVSVGTTLLLSFWLYHRAAFFSSVLLKNPQTQELLMLYAFSMPLGALHSCISGYWLARKKTGLPAFSQLAEQLARTGSTWLLFRILSEEGKPVTGAIAAAGSICGELAACLVCLLALGVYWKGVGEHLLFPPKRMSGNGKHFPKSLGRELAGTAVPLTLNRILLTLLGSMEMVLIPQRLLRYGMSQAEALSVYGVFTGMAMPLILFPATATHSVSAMLVPSIAGYQALGRTKQIRQAVKLVSAGCFFIGSMCTVLFFFFGNFLGVFLFHSTEAGIYIRTLAFVCPFLYVHTTLTAILNGMGKSGECLFQNILGLSLRIGFVLIAIPACGIRGYLYGILSSEIFLTLLHLFSLKQSLSV